MITALSRRLTPEDVQLYYQIALLGQKDLDLAPDSRMGFEMVMLRMLTFKPVAAEPMRIKPKQPNSTTRHQSTIEVEQIKEPKLVAEKITQEYSGEVKPGHNWIDMIAIMKLESLTRELANNCVLEQFDNEACKLLLDASHKHLLSPIREKKLEKALQDYRGTPLKLVINIERATIATPAAQFARDKEDRHQAAVDAINSDANIQALKEHFDARVMPGTIGPV
jgi:DNA polymerase-3 subunit gamma/tau